MISLGQDATPHVSPSNRYFFLGFNAQPIVDLWRYRLPKSREHTVARLGVGMGEEGGAEYLVETESEEGVQGLFQ